MTPVAAGIFRSAKGHLYERPRINGKRTWRRLHSRTITNAKAEVEARRSDHRRAKLGLCKDPYDRSAGLTVGDVINEYLLAGCPSRTLAVRSLQGPEKARIKHLLPFWTNKLAGSVTVVEVRKYYEHRKEKMRKGFTGGRAVDLEVGTLSNVLAWAHAVGKIPTNPLAGPRPRFRSKAIRHCRETMPLDADELHALARFLFEDPRSEALGWQLLLEAFTGCRTSEILRLRWDAKTRGQAGFLEGDWLWLERSKGGVNPFAAIHPALKDCIESLKLWTSARNVRRKKFVFTKTNMFWIPGRICGEPMSPGALTHALREAKAIHNAHRTSHGLRAYYVTVRRSQGISDAQIAAEIGDRTGPSIISSTYGDIPPNWRGSDGLAWLPAKAEPAWSVFGFPKNAVVLERKSWAGT